MGVFISSGSDQISSCVLPAIIKEIQTGPFTESTDHVTYRSNEYKRYMHVTPKRDMYVPIIDH